MPDRSVPPSGQLPQDSQPLETRAYRFSVEGTRPVLQFDISSGKADDGSHAKPERLTIELHTPMSGEVFEAKTQVGRIEVDRDGRVMYFCQSGESVGFTLFLGRSVVVTMARKTGEVLIQSPSRILSVEHEPSKESGGMGNAPRTETVRIVLE